MQVSTSTKPSLLGEQLLRCVDIARQSCASFLVFFWASLRASLLPWREQATEASPTAFLDGLRGYASLFVSFYHLRNGYTDSVHIGYGARPDATSLFQLPVMRLVFAGQQMVTIFFVVSGYSLALGTFKALKAGDVGKALDRIRSSVFRRFLRLYLPTVVSTFVVLCCINLGLYDWGHQMDIRGGYREPEPQVFDTAGLQLSNWIQETLLFVNVFEEPRHLYYTHSWSIPVEFVKSVQLYLVLVAMCKLRAVPRALVHATALTYCYYYGAFTLWTFLFGAGLAHFTVTFQDQRQSKAAATPKWETAAKTTVFLLGLYALSYPEWEGPATPGFRFLTPLLPPWWGNPPEVIHTPGAAMVVWSVGGTDCIRRVFSNKIARYLGRVSFALYLVHGIVIHVLGLWLLPLIWRWTGNETILKVDIGFFLGLIFYIPVCLVSADVFTRLVDEPSVRFAKWLEGAWSAESRSNGGYLPLPLVDVCSAVNE